MTIQTGIPIVDWFLAALDSWGYLIVLGFTVFENLFVVGSFTPGETVVIAGALVASRGNLHISLVWVASFFGTIIGSNISYWLGRRAGLQAVASLAERVAATRIGRILRIDPTGVDDIRTHFHTQGSKTVLLSRFAVGAKNFVPAVAGATNMPVFWYELYTVIGAMLYTSLMCAIGWFLGANLDVALRVAGGIGYVGLLVLLLFIAGLVVARNRLRARKSASDGDDE
jgi:membrane-associated protein